MYYRLKFKNSKRKKAAKQTTAFYSKKLSEWLFINPLSANPTKWSNTLKQFVNKLPTNCLSVFDNFMGLVLKGLNCIFENQYSENKAGIFPFSAK